MIRNARDGAAEALYGLGGAGTTQGDELAAMIYLRLALFLKPDHDLAAITIANLFEDLKRSDEAIRAYRAGPAGVADARDAPRSNRRSSSTRSAATTTRRRRCAPSSPPIPTTSTPGARSAACSDRPRHTKTPPIPTTRRSRWSATPDRSNWTLFYFRGICFERSKQWPKAEADFKKALELYPDQPQVLNYLGYSWVDRGVNLDEAFKMLRRAVDLRPNDGYIVDSLGWAHYKLGHYQEATEALEKAIDLKPADPVVNDHLGDAYWRVNRRIEAHFQWNHARDMKPDPEDLPEILDKIDHGLPDAPTASAPPASPAAAPSANQNGGG